MLGRCAIALIGVGRFSQLSADRLEKFFISPNADWQFDLLFHVQSPKNAGMPVHDLQGKWASKYNDCLNVESAIQKYYGPLPSKIQATIIKEFDTSAYSWRGAVARERMLESLLYLKSTKVKYDKVLVARPDAVFIEPLKLHPGKYFTHFEERKNKRPCKHSDLDYAYLSDFEAMLDYAKQDYRKRNKWDKLKSNLFDSFDKAFIRRFKDCGNFSDGWKKGYSGFHQYLVNNGYGIKIHSAILDRYPDAIKSYNPKDFK